MPPPGRGAAAYNNRIAVQKNVGADDSTGQPLPVWQTQFMSWAQIVPRGGNQRWIFEQLRSDISHLVRIRFSSQSKLILPNRWRFVSSDGAVLNVDGRINVDTRNIEFEFRCIEAQVPTAN
jgi:SPP1 family predicted phage head-tail adaptor